MPESRELLLGEPADGALLSDAVSLTPDVTVKCDASGKGYRIKLKGKPDPLATVIRFCREAPEKNAEAEWINDTDKRIRYDGAWKYCYLKDKKMAWACWRTVVLKRITIRLRGRATACSWRLMAQLWSLSAIHAPTMAVRISLLTA
jgi:hypothetical protein